MSKLSATIKHELMEMLPPTLFFSSSFTLSRSFAR